MAFSKSLIVKGLLGLTSLATVGVGSAAIGEKLGLLDGKKDTKKDEGVTIIEKQDGGKSEKTPEAATKQQLSSN